MKMIIGLTGGIASGKSTVSNYLKTKGFSIYDADKIAKKLLDEKENINEITKIFGKKILNENLKIDRAKLKEIVFKNSNLLKKLNKILHPKVFSFYEEIRKNFITNQLNTQKLSNEVIFFDVPLLFEAGFDILCDKIWLVITDRNIQIKRIIERDKISEELAEKIISSQMSDEEKRKKANFVIENNGTLEELKEKIDKLCKEIDL